MRSSSPKGGARGRSPTRGSSSAATSVRFERDLGRSDVFAAGAFRTLTAIECHTLSFALLVEGGLTARRIVEEVLVAVVRQDKAEALVADESLDRALH